MKAIWQNIYQDIRKGILDGTYPFQSLLPSESALVEVYGCSHNTLRKALSALADEGMLQPAQGKGVRVVFRGESRASFEVGSIETFAESMERLGMESKTRVCGFEHIIADEEIARLTGFEAGTPLVHIERVRIMRGEAVIRDVGYFLEEATPGLTREIAEKSIYRYLEDEVGLKIGQAQRRITVRRASARDRELLDIEDDAYLAVVTNQTFSLDGAMFEASQSRHRAEEFAFHDVARRKP